MHWLQRLQSRIQPPARLIQRVHSITTTTSSSSIKARLHRVKWLRRRVSVRRDTAELNRFCVIMSRAANCYMYGDSDVILFRVYASLFLPPSCT